MNYITDITEYEFNKPQAITIGKFDGIHVGHEYLVKKIVEKKQEGYEATVITFSVSPRKVLKDNNLKMLITKDERNKKLEKDGVDNVIEFSFDDEFMKTLAVDFIGILVHKLNMKYMCVGDDFKFGYKGRGDRYLLEECSKKYEFKLDVIKRLRAYDDAISSSRIREEIEYGHVQLAKELLGYPYFVWGKIVHGNHIGRTIDFPTVNIVPEKEKCLPKYGVYFTKVFYDNKEGYGITNVGVKPTVTDEGRVTVETYIIDEETDLYDSDVKVEFIERMRDEVKFDSIDKLKLQLKLDVKTARELIEELNIKL